MTDAEDRAALHERLTEERARTKAQVEALTRDFDGIVESSEGANVDDEHDPEGATIAFERAQVSALIDRARDNLAILERSLEKLEGDEYGRCARCGGPIGFDRLMALPTAEQCVRCAANSEDRSMLQGATAPPARTRVTRAPPRAP